MVVDKYVARKNIYIFNGDEKMYEGYKTDIFRCFPNSLNCYIVGSANWGVSLNPQKNYRPFGEWSDVDIAVVNEEEYENTWCELRKYHRQWYYQLNQFQKSGMAKTASNIYCGFANPKWIPGRSSYKSDFILKLDGLYNAKLPPIQGVNAMFFKSFEEMKDYYKRSFIIAQGDKA